MVQEVGQCLHPMVDLDTAAPPTSSCLDDDRALALVDGQLSREDRDEVEAHLDVCAVCRRFVSELAKESLFASPTELPTEVERTGYAPGRPRLLDVALTARHVAATRDGGSDPTVRPDRAVRPADFPPRQAGPARAPRDEPTRSRGDPASARGSTSVARRLDPSLVVLVAVALSLSILTALAALISLGAFGYALFLP